jgi:transposase
MRSEAAFARLAGVAPIPASSGDTVRYRLSRTGDRKPNAAIHTIALVRHQAAHQPATKLHRSIPEAPDFTGEALKAYAAG